MIFPFPLSDPASLAVFVAAIVPGGGGGNAALSSNVPGPGTGDFQLQENGDFILQENGDFQLQEAA